MTFTLPESLAQHFASKVPARQRSRFLAEALRNKLSEREQEIIRACEIANRDPEVRAIEKEFDAISGEITEPWTGAPARRGMVGRSRSNARVRN